MQVRLLAFTGITGVLTAFPYPVYPNKQKQKNDYPIRLSYCHVRVPAAYRRALWMRALLTAQSNVIIWALPRGRHAQQHDLSWPPTCQSMLCTIRTVSLALLLEVKFCVVNTDKLGEISKCTKYWHFFHFESALNVFFSMFQHLRK